MGSVPTSNETSFIRLKEFIAAPYGFKYPELELSTDDAPNRSVTSHSKHILILGAGVSGLMVAWMLLDKGYRVTIIADDWAWNRDFEKSRMTSQIAGALWEFPPGGFGVAEGGHANDGWTKMIHQRQWAVDSFDFYNQYDKIDTDFEKHGRSLGLQMTKLHQFYFDNVVSGGEDEESKKLEALKKVSDERSEFEMGIKTYDSAEKITAQFPNVNNKGEIRQKFTSAYSHRTPIINTDKAMAYLMALVTAKGAQLETQKFVGSIKTFGESLLKDHGADVIVNATGIAAKELAEDDDVFPMRGAVKRIDNTRNGQFRHLNDAYLVPAQKDSLGHVIKSIVIIPRSDDVLYIGSLMQSGNYGNDLTPDSPEVQVMWNRAGEFMPKLLAAGVVPSYPFAQGLRPCTKKNAKVRADEETKFHLVHNYGHGGAGWTLGVGTARTAVAIVEALLGALPDGRTTKALGAKEINEKIYGKRSE
ncbi:uncharacterized protein DNG_04292 [Cephalotrichum gorgonifer]|uniref:FAD dependent oxidoreductase domain-containing protein n=1 Tax=Cephalotrichum gorgonifer TaxID=2041049 RepID=A0AAE8SUS8_9PEZI|nr:uncharacterized protein DNG_04292 [Cephalotrichum gorgonifer]